MRSPRVDVIRRARGRGVGFSVGRGLIESVLRVVYRGDWPARLWSVVPSATRVEVARHELRLPPGIGSPLRVAFISDLHIGPTTPLPLLEAAFARVREARPDVLLLGGDYVFLEAEAARLETLEALVGSVPSPVKLAVLGNHDLWTHDDAIAAALSRAGARVLMNDAAALPAPWSDVVVVGLDDPWAGECDIAAAAAQVDGQPFRIVLCHGPDGLLHLSGFPFDAFLAGHTHGGQIATPWGPIVLPHGRMCRRFPAGPATFGGGFVHVSRGVGATELPMRTFAAPEVVLLEFVRPAVG